MAANHDDFLLQLIETKKKRKRKERQQTYEYIERECER